MAVGDGICVMHVCMHACNKPARFELRYLLYNNGGRGRKDFLERGVRTFAIPGDSQIR